MTFNKNSYLFKLFALLSLALGACSSDDSNDDERLAEAERNSKTSYQGTSNQIGQYSGDARPSPVRTPIANVSTGGSCSTQGNSTYQRVQSPKEPISANCSTELTYTVAATVDGPRYYLKGRIEPSCGASALPGQLLIKTNYDLPLMSSLTCYKTTAPYSVKCHIADVQSFISNGFVTVEIAPDPTLPYNTQAKFEVIRN